MDFDDTPEEAAFRATVRSWIRANAPRRLEPELSRAAFASKAIASEDPLAASRAWQKTKADAGYACLSWPKEYGGGGFSPMQQVIWQQEEGVFGLLSMIFAIGQGVCGPTLISWASDEQKAARLPTLASGEEIWCQLFSEPAAGSDLAALRTYAARAEDGSGDWIVNGQKMWTSNAHISDWGLLLARTDRTVPKHKGLTMFFVDMRSAGIDVRPVRQANGDAGFSEVFMTDLRIPDVQRLGGVGEGWKVSITTLANERMSIGTRSMTGVPELLELCCNIETATGLAIDDPAVRAKLALWIARANALRHTAMRAISSVSRGEAPGPENSVGKLVAAELARETAAYALELQGQAGILTSPELAQSAGWFQTMLLRAPAMRLAGGSDEILRNIIAQRILGLPAEPRVDKGIPFNEIPTGR
jgi:alkylation response protein AidB-like acyl-CoA dehydrogenase